MVEMLYQNLSANERGYAAYAVLADDYERMLADGMLLDENEPFDSLMERCASIEARANGGYDDA